MNASTQQRYRGLVWFSTDGALSVHTAGCRLCHFHVSLRGGNALARAAKVRGAAQRHVREAHPDALEERDRAGIVR